jgi:hypothetical protein
MTADETRALTFEDLKRLFPEGPAPHEKLKTCANAWCKRKGHTKRTCRTKKPEGNLAEAVQHEEDHIEDQRAEANYAEADIIALTVQASSGPNRHFKADSGANRHLIGDTIPSGDFSRYTSTSVHISGIGGGVEARGRGDYGSLGDALHTPNPTNLLSVSQACAEHDVAFVFRKGSWGAYASSTVTVTGDAWLSGSEHNGLYGCDIERDPLPKPCEL